MTGSYSELKHALEAGQAIALATVIGGPGLGTKLLVWPGGRTRGSLGSPDLDGQVVGYALVLIVEQRSDRRAFKREGQAVDVFVEVFVPPPKLVIVGAVHVAIPLVTFAKAIGFRTIVIDARSAFATPERFAHADELIISWPSEALGKIALDESTYFVVLSHDEKLDNPALKIALDSPARYIGALGSTKTHARRVQALREMGASDEQLARIHAPIGLNLGASEPEEIAVSIIAEIVAVRHGIGSKQPSSMSSRAARPAVEASAGAS